MRYIHIFGYYFQFQTFFNLISSRDRKSTRLNSSHRCISYAVFCLKKKKCRLQSPPPSLCSRLRLPRTTCSLAGSFFSHCPYSYRCDQLCCIVELALPVHNTSSLLP